MIEKIIDINQPLMDPGASSNKPNTAGAIPDKDADVSVHVNYASLIEKATQTPQMDAQLVQRARKLLLSGQLENPKIIREAVKNIIKFGI